MQPFPPWPVGAQAQATSCVLNYFVHPERRARLLVSMYPKRCATIGTADGLRDLGLADCMRVDGRGLADLRSQRCEVPC